MTNKNGNGEFHLRQLFPSRWVNAYYWWRADRLQRPYLDEFTKFYEELDEKHDIFYVFFTSGLLHWMYKTVEQVPDHIHVVLLGCGLDSDEVRWIEENVDRPFFHLRERVDDKTIWEFLFRVNRHNFGWLDVDCIVTNPSLFDEMVAIPKDAAINCIWSYRGSGDHYILCTHFLFINIEAIRELRRRGLEPSPCTYNYEGTIVGRVEGEMAGRLRKFEISRIPTKKQIKVLKGFLPLDEKKRPVYPSAALGFPSFDTMVMFQVLANAIGLRLNRVREIDGLYEGNPELYFADHDFTDLVHPGGVSWYQILRHDPEGHGRYLMLVQAEYSLLRRLEERLPRWYQERFQRLSTEIEEEGLSPEMAEMGIRSYLMSKGASEDSLERIFP